MDDTPDVDLTGLGTPAAERVIAADGSVLLRHVGHGVPAEVGADRQLGATGWREEQVEERVGPDRGEGGEVVAADGDLPETGGHLSDGHDLGEEGAVRAGDRTRRDGGAALLGVGASHCREVRDA